jgi:hypothetical protein
VAEEFFLFLSTADVMPMIREKFKVFNTYLLSSEAKTATIQIALDTFAIAVN